MSMFQVFVSLPLPLPLPEPFSEPLPVPLGLPYLGVCVFPLPQTFAKCPCLPQVLQVASLYQQSFL